MRRPGVDFMPDHSPSLSKVILVKNELGLHARPAAMIAKIAKKANSRVWIILGDEIVDASNIMDILAIGCAAGSVLTVRVEDRSDLNVLDSIAKLVEKGFEE
jgi:phosphotransferase system HPr (HPr) family protein